MKFTKDWHTKHSKYWLTILKNYINKPYINYLEIGVFEGRSMTWMMDNILTHPTSSAIGIDSWINKDKQFKRT